MNIRFTSPAEALAGVASIVVAADSMASLAEQHYLFEQIKELAPFKDYTQPDFNRLLDLVTQRLYDTLPTDPETMALTSQSVEIACRAMCECLNQELREVALQMAAGLARADRTSDDEKRLLWQLARGLEITPQIAQDILGMAPGL